MAFHQTTRQAMQRIARPAAEEREQPRVRTNNPAAHPLDSQTWVLFSPVTEGTATSYLSETDEPFVETPGHSRISDLGSLDSQHRPGRLPGNLLSSAPSASLHATEDDLADQDDAELDSLDSHLPSFRSVPDGQTALGDTPAPEPSAPVFPAHDGLGSFRLDMPALGSEAQEHIYQFERFNPRRTRRRRESLEQVPQMAMEPEASHMQELEKRQRIEAWRLEHSRLFLEDVQRKTRRRKRSQAAVQRLRASASQPVPVRDGEDDNMTWHDEEGFEGDGEANGYLVRVTRTIVRDLLGIDDGMLNALFGGPLTTEDDLSTTPRASGTRNYLAAGVSDIPPWHSHFLERVSRELGLLVNNLSHHPGAFSTYSRVQQLPLPYAGLPAIPESAGGTKAVEPQTGDTVPEFQPTVQALPTNPIDIPGRGTEAGEQADGSTFTKEEWERDLDIKLVFRYLRSRFSSQASDPSEATSYMTSSTPQNAAAQAARIRQYHPLIARSRPPLERRAYRPATPGSPIVARRQSSCASQSTRRSPRSSCSSRHYWDIGGSLGTGSIVAPTGPMGSWGEV